MSIQLKNEIGISRLRKMAAKDHSHKPEDIDAADTNEAVQLKEKINTHCSGNIFSEQGAHSFRWYNDKLEFFNGTGWIELQKKG